MWNMTISQCISKVLFFGVHEELTRRVCMSKEAATHKKNQERKNSLEYALTSLLLCEEC